MQKPIPAGTPVPFDTFAFAMEKSTCADDPAGRIASYFGEDAFPGNGYASTYEFLSGLDTCALCGSSMNWLLRPDMTSMQVLEPAQIAFFADIFPEYCHAGCNTSVIPQCGE